MPIRATGGFGAYATTPIVVGGTVYTQDINSNVYSINLKSGKVNWFKKYNSPSVGPNGVTVEAVSSTAPPVTRPSPCRRARASSSGSKKLTRNKNEGIDMAPGVNNGTVYVSTVPGNSAGFYNGNGQAILWALNAKTGAAIWKWDEVPTDLWSKANTKINSGGGQWDPPSFDANGDIYVGVSNPAPFPGVKAFPFGSSRPGKDLYTDSIVKLDHTTGKLVWYYQLTPHDINDWDMENSPILTKAERQERRHRRRQGRHRRRGRPDHRQAALEDPGRQAQRPRPRRPADARPGEEEAQVPVHRVPRASSAASSRSSPRTARTCTPPSTTSPRSTRTTPRPASSSATFTKGTGDLVALNQATGKIVWDTKLNQSPYGAMTITNDVVFTTTFDGTVSAYSTKTGKKLWSAKLPANTNTPVAVAGNTMITAGSFPLKKTQKPQIVAYRLGG